jgi:YD repeat-containing protein
MVLKLLSYQILFIMRFFGLFCLLFFAKLAASQGFTYDHHNRLTAIDYPDKRIEYTYDKLGNRLSEKVISAYCASTVSGYKATNPQAVSYQWQVNSGSGFVNLSDGIFYVGTLQDSLIIKNPPTSFAFNYYRCIISTQNSTVFSPTWQFRIKATWTGAADTAWNNAANWECSLVPDQYVDALLPSGKSNYPTVSGSANVNSLKLENGSSLNVAAGVILDIKSRQQ